MTDDTPHSQMDEMPLRTALEEPLRGELAAKLAPGRWNRFTLVTRGGGATVKESLRPLTIGDDSVWQLETLRDKRMVVRNISSQTELNTEIERFLQSTGPREYHLLSYEGDVHLRITRKGRHLVSRGQSQKAGGSGSRPEPSHDRMKRHPLTRFESSALLHVLGIADSNGEILPSMRRKYDQVNSFLREIDLVIPRDRARQTLDIVDCGSGRAYLTLAAWCYLRQVHGITVKTTGIDRNKELIAKSNEMAASLDAADEVEFLACDIADFQPQDPPDLVLSLHSCDDATDMALAGAVKWGAASVLAAPCCQHELHRQIKAEGSMRALLRYSILRERQADLLTDAFRAQILRILGYRVKVVEFVDFEATARNIMIRAVSGIAKGQAGAVTEYLKMRGFWQATPILETLLQKQLEPFL